MTLIAYGGACLSGWASRWRGCRGFVSCGRLRGFTSRSCAALPIIVLLLYVAFVVAQGLVAAGTGGRAAGAGRGAGPGFPLLWRAVIALMLAYSGFWPRSPRGLQAVDKGQIEAAKALGLNGWQRFRHIVFPQASGWCCTPWAMISWRWVKDSRWYR